MFWSWPADEVAKPEIGALVWRSNSTVVMLVWICGDWKSLSQYWPMESEVVE